MAWYVRPSMRRLMACATLVAALFVPTLSGLAASPSVTHADPSMGPNARDEARHAHDPLHFAPATTAIQPLRARRALPASQPYQPQRPATNPARAVDREVLGFAPYWAIANSSPLNL